MPKSISNNMLFQQFKTILILSSAAACLVTAIISNNIFVSNFCASLSIIILATAPYLMLDKTDKSIRQ